MLFLECGIRFKTNNSENDSKGKRIPKYISLDWPKIFIWFDFRFFEKAFLILWEFLNIEFIKLINEFYKNKIKFKIQSSKFKIESIKIKFKILEFNLDKINNNFDYKDLYDIKIYFRYDLKNNNRNKKWKIYYKKSYENNWEPIFNYRLGTNWTWKHKGALLGKMFKNYIPRNNCLIVKNVINLNRYNLSQPDLFFISLFYLIFNWSDKNLYLNKNDFVENWWFENWGYRLPENLWAFNINNLNNAINKFGKVKSKKYEDIIEFKQKILI